MIFISAQPDHTYFFWQLEVQLYNFKRLGIDLSKVHQVFLSQVPMSEEYKAYKAAHPEVNIHFYHDSRKSKGYIPSQRPNALKQYFAEFPHLENERIFYHDSDIIFRELPDFDKLTDENTWYLSDTNSYLNADYIKSKGDTLLSEMANIVGVSVEKIEAINKDSGGAQYLFNSGINALFWAKMEEDCETLYSFLENAIPRLTKEFAKKTGQSEGSYHPLQNWTVDMWCLLWGGLIIGKKMKVVPEFNFSWATGSKKDYESAPIFHNAGVTGNEANRLFYKGAYINKSPFGEDFSFVDKDSASAMYVKEIENCHKNLLCS